MKSSSKPPEVGLALETDPEQQERLNWKRIEGIARFLESGAKNNPDDLSSPVISPTELAWFADLLLKAGRAPKSKRLLLDALGFKRQAGRPGIPKLTAAFVGKMILLHEGRGMTTSQAIAYVRDHIALESDDGYEIPEQTLRNWRNNADSR